MTDRIALRPKEPRNLKITAALAGVMLVVYGVASYLGPWSPKKGLGLAFGFLATLLFVFEMAYPWRRSRARPLGTAKAWIQAHIYLGVLAFVAVVVHSDLSWPRGSMGWALLVLSLWTTVSGLAGVFLQKWIPATLSENLRVEALYERIPALVASRLAEADALMAGASDLLARFYRTEARKLIETVRPSWSFLLDIRGGRDRALEPFRRMGQFVDAEEKKKLDDLVSIYIEKVELDAQYSLQGILRRWLVWHVPPAALLMAAVVVHIVGWMAY
jgi:hypothetical protein